MKLQNADPHTIKAVERLPAFSLATALAWLGHDCGGTCPRQAVNERASVWLIRPPAEARATGMRALVEVAFTACTRSPDQGIATLREINKCTGRDRIHVRERCAADRSAIDAVNVWLSDVVVMS